MLLRAVLRTASFSFFFFNDTATTEIYTLSLHDALPISNNVPSGFKTLLISCNAMSNSFLYKCSNTDRKSTRLNSSHTVISYAVFCLKKKKKHNRSTSKLIELQVAV